jgi:nucleoid-associated protein YgaU
VTAPLQPGRRTLTPAVGIAAIFAATAAVVSVAFVMARGGLQLPLATASAPPVAVVSPGAPNPPASPAATAAASPSAAPSSPEASAPPTPPPTAGPSAAPTGIASPTLAPDDPLRVLAGCPDHPGCYLYTVRRGDTYSGVSDRYGVLLWIMDALNPEVADKGIIVVGQTLYLGRDPMARLDPCPDGSCHLYAVRSGDTLSGIASRYGLGVSDIRTLNPDLDPGHIVAGRVIRLPLYEAP